MRTIPSPSAAPLPWTVAIVCCALVLDGARYLAVPPVWHDEAALIVNVLDKSFVEQLGPLTYGEAAPPLFLWLERGVVLVLGDSLYALRLVPLLAGMASLLLFARLALRHLPALGVVASVLLFASSDRLLWHTLEAKPYALDVFLALLVVTLVDETRTWRLGWRLALWTVLAPVLIFLSFPGCFLAGGLLLAELPTVWTTRDWRTWVGYALWTMVVAGSFLMLLTGPIHAQRCHAMDECWTASFPDWQRPLSVLWWTIRGTLGVLHYAAVPAGEGLIVTALGGVLWWLRSKEFGLNSVLWVPPGLAVLAGLLHAYPFSGSRVMAYAIPAVVLAVGAGVALVLDWLWPRARVVAFVFVGFLLVTPGYSLYRIVNPWLRPDTGAASAYVLDHRNGTEPIAANAWEYGYYFRRQGRAFTMLDARTGMDHAGGWLVLTAWDSGERARLAEGYSRGRVVHDRAEFSLTTVLRLGPLDELAAGRQEEQRQRLDSLAEARYP